MKIKIKKIKGEACKFLFQRELFSGATKNYPVSFTHFKRNKFGEWKQIKF